MSTPLDRQELAKAARIKRPSTTLPLSRIHAEERKQNHSHEHTNQQTIGMAQPREVEPKTSMSVDKIVLPTENTTTSDSTHRTNLERSLGDGNFSQQINLNNNEGLTSNSGYEFHELGEQCQSLGSHATQQSSAVTEARETNFIQSIGSPTYLGLPLRGSWRHEGQSQSSVVSNQQPHFLHQLQQEAPKQFDTIPGYTRITQYELYDIPEEEEAVLMQEEYEDCEYHEASVAGDSVDGHYFHHHEDASVGNIDHGNVDQLGMEYYPGYGIYGELELDHLQDSGSQREVNKNQITTKNDFMDQQLETPFQPEGQEAYSFYDLGQYSYMEGLWRSHRSLEDT